MKEEILPDTQASMTCCDTRSSALEVEEEVTIEPADEEPPADPDLLDRDLTAEEIEFFIPQAKTLN